jgi:hypothetical protein
MMTGTISGSLLQQKYRRSICSDVVRVELDELSPGNEGSDT